MADWAVIMAGGVGKRFWPMSLQRKPKQFLALSGGASLLEECYQRLLRYYDEKRILIAASAEHRECFVELLPNFPLEQVLWEPVGRNTAACIAWASESIRRKDPEAIIGVFPSDHSIHDVEEFALCIERACAQARGRIVLFGIEPTRAETGYGYIEMGGALREASDGRFYGVKRFCEKPALEMAKQYLESGRYLWNGGIFIYDAVTMMQELKAYEPELYDGVISLCDRPSELETIFPSLKSISIDYAVMERTKNCVVERVNFAWNDIGSWAAVQELFESDSSGNTVVGDAYVQDCEDVFVFSTKEKFVAALGVKDLVIVNTPNAVLVTTPARAQEVRKIVDALEREGREDLL
ncbi:MAG: mannose-1-phosphate guanylyltransferase [Bradymonadales bacterium]